MRGVGSKLLLTFLIGLILNAAYLFLPDKVISLDDQLRDFLFHIRGELPKEESHEIVIVDIDEKSIRAIGQWPWSRDIVSQLLQAITYYEPGIIGLDIVFAEPDRTSPHLLADQLPPMDIALANFDAQLADTFLNTPVVGGYTFFFDQRGSLEPPVLPAIFIAPQNNRLLKPKSLASNIPILQNALYSSGFFNNIPDENGMIRYVSLLMEYDNMVFSSLALEMVRLYSGVEKVEFIPTGNNSGIISFGDFEVPVDQAGRMYVNFRGPSHHFEYVSALDVLEGNISPEQLQNKFVLVGTSALGLYDLRSTTFDRNIPGVEIHANAIDNILKGDFIQRTEESVFDDLIVIWITLIVTLLLFHIIPSWGVPFMFVLLAGGLGATFYTLLFEYGTIFNILFPAIAFILAMLISIGVDYFVSQKQKEETRQILGKKVSPGVMDYLLKHKTEALVAPQEVEVTIFFSDVQSFTTISEKLGSPSRLIKMLNDYMTPMVDNIVSRKGTIDKFIGDAIMAYWNAPVPVRQHPDEALTSAIEQLKKLKEVNVDIKKEFDLEIGVSIGIHTGIVTAGDMGSEGRSDYTIIGDNVNLASRLEGLTRQYGANILISRATYELLKGSYSIRPVDIVEVKGKSEAVEIFEVLDFRDDIDEDEINNSVRALTLFREEKLEDAKVIFEVLQENRPSKLYAQYIDRCNYFLENPEVTFTPVKKMTTK